MGILRDRELLLPVDGRAVIGQYCQTCNTERGNAAIGMVWKGPRLVKKTIVITNAAEWKKWTDFGAGVRVEKDVLDELLN